jgi:hypothetical protein|tara:strand:+ start:5 stop:205 length:201 start_codon:yes stop_codon:yes gene_type:complete
MTIQTVMNKTLMPISVTIKYYQLEELVKFLSSDSVKTVRSNNITLDILSSEMAEEFQVIKQKVESI